MEIKETDGEGRFEPVSRDDSILVSLLFEKITEHRPDWPMGDRTDLAMSMFTVVKKWAHNLDLTSDHHKIVEIDAIEHEENMHDRYYK